LGTACVAMSVEAKKYFISYSRADSEFVQDLANNLTQAGVDIWLDTQDIEPGRVWDNALEDALRSSTGLIVILTPASINSPFVKKEIVFAQNNNKEIYPILAEACELPLLLADRQYVDFTEDDYLGFSQLTTALEQSTGLRKQLKIVRTGGFWRSFKKGSTKQSIIGLLIGAIYGLLITLGLDLSGGGIPAILEGMIVYGICGGLAGLIIPNRRYSQNIFVGGLMVGMLMIWVWAAISKGAAINYTLVVGPLIGAILGTVSSRLLSH